MLMQTATSMGALCECQNLDTRARAKLKLYSGQNSHSLLLPWLHVLPRSFGTAAQAAALQKVREKHVRLLFDGLAYSPENCCQHRDCFCGGERVAYQIRQQVRHQEACATSTAKVQAQVLGSLVVSADVLFSKPA